MKVRDSKRVASDSNRVPRSPRMTFAAALMTTTALATLLAMPASAQTVWQGPTNDWFTAGNWNPNTIPTGTDDVIINSGPQTVIDAAAANAANIMLADGAVGQLIIANGGTLNGTAGIIGNLAGSDGALVVTGTGSAWTSSGAVTVGNFGEGTLGIMNGGMVDVGTFFRVADKAGSTGLVVVDGVGSSLAVNVLRIGEGGSGTLSVDNGGAVNSGASTLGVNAGSVGSVTVAGAGSIWESDQLTVGQSGQGSLTILNGGKVNVDQGLLIASDVGSYGTITVSGAGAQLNIDNNSALLLLGYGGTGVLNITNGGAVSAYSMFVGGFTAAGSGELHITNGGTLTAFGGSVGVDGPGAATVDGAGSSWTNTDMLLVGVSGAGTLTISNGGVVSNADGFIGHLIASGSVIVTGAGSTWTNTGNLHVGEVSHGELTISNGGTVNSANGYIGSGAGSTGSVLVTGMGSTWNNAGALVVGGVGSGTLNVSDGGVVTSPVTLLENGFLRGNGTVGGIIANAGGVVAPGNSIGTLTVNGNASFAAGSTYQVELNSAGQSDLIHATGTATIANGALLSVTKLDAAPLVVGTKYTVLQADGGVTGTFTLANPSTFLGLTASYDPTHVYLDVVKLKTFASIGVTPNQIATGGAAEVLGAGNSIFDAVLMLPSDAAARAAFDQLSGEVHASAKTVLIDDSRFVRDAALNRLRAASGGVGASNAPVSVMDAYGAYTKVAPTTEHVAIWGQGFGSWGQWNGNGNAARLDRDTGGFIVGVDQTAFDSWRVGAFGGYSTTRFNINARNSSGSSDNYHVGAYGGTSWGSLALRSGFAYAWHDIKTTRHVAFPGFTDTLKAGYEAGTAQAFGELAYGFRQASVAFEPFANLAYVNLRTDGFTEKGGAAALTSANAVVDSVFTTLGLRASTNFGTNTTARGSLGWRHAYGDTIPATTLAFAGGSPFTISGAPIAQDAAVLDLGVDFNLARNAVLGISYGGQFGSDAIDQTVRANFTAKF